MILYYAHDPMCSYCWAFRPVWQGVKKQLSAHHKNINISYLMGGLAPDSDQAMPDEIRDKVQHAWRHIQDIIPGTQFNFDFWSSQQPRRSTYPSCRAVCAVNQLDPSLEEQMILAIQQAYYLNAKNPSDDDTLISCASSLGLSSADFQAAYQSKTCNEAFKSQRTLFHDLGLSSFPSLLLSHKNQHINIPIDYNSTDHMLIKIQNAITAVS